MSASLKTNSRIASLCQLNEENNPKEFDTDQG